MTQLQNNLAIKLLEEHFGDIVTSVGRCLLEHGTLPMREIIDRTNENIASVKNALVVLIEHDLVSFHLNNRGLVSYRLKSEDVHPMLSYPLYIGAAEKLFGVEGKLIIEQILLSGRLKLSEIVEKVKNESETCGEPIQQQTIRNKFINMVDNHYLQRCSTVVQEPNVIKVLMPTESELYVVPNAPPNSEVYWKLNFDTFSLYLRNCIIIESIERKFDSTAAVIIETMLRLMESYSDVKCIDSNPISKITISNELPSDSGIVSAVLDQYLTRMADDSVQIISKVDDHQGGMYSLRLSKFINSLTWAMIERIVVERFDSKHCRIFRLIRQKEFLEQKEIETMSMILPKEAKLITYTLLAANLIHLQEVPQTADYANSKTFFLFCIRFPQVVRMLLEWCHKSLFNLKVARQCEVKQNKRLLEKKQKIQAIIDALKSQDADPAQIAEVEEMITPPETLVLENVQKASDKLDSGEINLLECLLIFKFCINYHTLK